MSDMKLSIVSTLYKSAEVVPELVSNLANVARQVVGDSYEIILVDDGCPDGSGQVALGLVSNFRELRVLQLSRNFGQHIALLAGLEKAKGAQVFILDGDLEEDPAWLKLFWDRRISHSADVVFGYQSANRRGRADAIAGFVGFSLLNRFTGLRLQPNIVTARLMSRKYVDALLTYKEREVFIAGLWQIAGFLQEGVQVVKKSRSSSTYTFATRLDKLMVAITSFSSAPLRAVFSLGLIASGISLSIVFAITILWFLGDPLEGWASVLASVWLLGSLVLLSLGIIARYLATMYVEVKARPRHVEKGWSD